MRVRNSASSPAYVLRRHGAENDARAVSPRAPSLGRPASNRDRAPRRRRRRRRDVGDNRRVERAPRGRDRSGGLDDRRVESDRANLEEGDVRRRRGVERERRDAATRARAAAAAAVTRSKYSS